MFVLNDVYTPDKNLYMYKFGENYYQLRYLRVRLTINLTLCCYEIWKLCGATSASTFVDSERNVRTVHRGMIFLPELPVRVRNTHGSWQLYSTPSTEGKLCLPNARAVRLFYVYKCFDSILNRYIYIFSRNWITRRPFQLG